jgi:ParB family chromosome partitioning protein
MQILLKRAPAKNRLPQLPSTADEENPIVQHATIRTASHAHFFRSSWNARKKLTDVTELKALIRAQGLLQNLVGYAEVVDGRETGRIGLAAGDRRWTSIGALIEEGSFPADYQIPYLLVTEDEALDISLVENLGREEMHPADIFEAMLALTRLGRSVEDIALKFNLDVGSVKKRLKLANVAPRLLDLYRKDEASFEQMMALAISDDQAAQEQVWDSLGTFRCSPHEIRRLLTAQQINVRTDRVARYVGVAAFEKAGGVVTRDLFSHVDDGYTDNVALLERLALEKLEKQRAKLLKEGVSWVDILMRADHATLSEYANVRSVAGPLGEEQLARLAQLDAEIATIDAAMEGIEGDEEDESYLRLEGERIALECERRAMQASRPVLQNAQDKVLAGAVLALDDYGSLIVKRDLIRPADKAKMTTAEAQNDRCADAAGAGRARHVHSDRLTFVLSSHRTAALQAEMVDRSDIALVYLTYTLLRQVLGGHSAGSLAKVSVGGAALAEAAQTSRASEVVKVRREDLCSRLPDDAVAGGWLEWLARQSTAVVLEYMAFCVASSLDATQHREGDSPQFRTLARGLGLDMSKWWTATAEAYFDHVSKERVLAVVTEKLSAPAAVPLSKMQKGTAAAAAERALADTRWLPEALRTS